MLSPRVCGARAVNSEGTEHRCTAQGRQGTPGEGGRGGWSGGAGEAGGTRRGCRRGPATRLGSWGSIPTTMEKVRQETAESEQTVSVTRGAVKPEEVRGGGRLPSIRAEELEKLRTKGRQGRVTTGDRRNDPKASGLLSCEDGKGIAWPEGPWAHRRTQALSRTSGPERGPIPTAAGRRLFLSAFWLCLMEEASIAPDKCDVS